MLGFPSSSLSDFLEKLLKPSPVCDERRTSTFVVSYSPECMSEAAEAPSHRTVTYNSIVQTESECFDGQSEVPPAKSQLKVRAYVASHVL